MLCDGVYTKMLTGTREQGVKKVFELAVQGADGMLMMHHWQQGEASPYSWHHLHACMDFDSGIQCLTASLFTLFDDALTSFRLVSHSGTQTGR